MKTWEMIKSLTDNPNSKFKRIQDGRIFYQGNNGTLFREPGFVEGISPDDEWELVHEPVNFMTAIKAFDEGKKITCKDTQFGTRSYIRKSSMCRHLVDNTDLPITPDEILEGKWYIEDDTP